MTENVTKSYKPYLGFLLALAFFAQSLLPVGYMPKFHTGKILEITICHGNDIAKLLVDEHMQPVKAGNGSEDGKEKSGDHFKSCPYSAVSSKNITLLTFLYHYMEKLTYERFVELKMAQLVSYFIHPSYEGRAPPYSLA